MYASNLYDTLPQEVMDKVFDRIPRVVFTILLQKVSIAGGFIRSIINNEEIADIDLFAKDLKTVEDVTAWLESRGYTLFSTKNAITCTKAGEIKLQFITRWMYEEPQHLIDSFDYTIAKAAVWVEMDSSTGRLELKSLTSLDYMQDVTDKRLVYTSPKRDEDSAGSLRRLMKFVAWGYHYDKSTFSAVVARSIAGEGIVERIVKKIISYKWNKSYARGGY